MAGNLVNWFVNLMNGAPKELIIFLISMIPILELRGGVLAASALGVPMWRAVLFCVAGNIVPIPFILLLITPIFSWLKQTRYLKPKIERLEAKSLAKSEQIQKYEFAGLLIFVGIPLPGTGAWTGSLIAALLGIKTKKALPAIILGVFMAAAIMCVISYGIPALVRMIG